MRSPQSRQLSNNRSRAFALVIALMLVALLAVTGSGLATLASTESIRAGVVARDLDHELAVRSLIACLPQLRTSPQEQQQSAETDPRTPPFTMRVGDCDVRCTLTTEAGKFHIGERSGGTSVIERLRGLAQAHQLPETSVQVREVQPSDASRGLPRLVWFDQLFAPAGFEEVFRMYVPGRAGPEPRRKVWFDLVTFWDGQGEVLALEVSTTIGSDVRNWYLVIDMVDGRAEVLYQGLV